MGFPVAYQLNQHNKYFLMDDSYERAGTIGFRCAADSSSAATNGPNNWNGQGTYCKADLTLGTGVFCGMINAQNGNNNLTEYGSLDWIQFGSNAKDSSLYKMIRKEAQSEYIVVNMNNSVQIETYQDNPTSFYWKDGQKDIPVLSIDDATTNGIYITNSELKWSIINLKSGSVYRFRIYIGVYKDFGRLNATLTVGSNTYSFTDQSVENYEGTMDMAYGFIINLQSVSSDETIQLMMEWIKGNGDGNITLQAIAFSLVS